MRAETCRSILNLAAKRISRYDGLAFTSRITIFIAPWRIWIQIISRHVPKANGSIACPWGQGTAVMCKAKCFDASRVSTKARHNSTRRNLHNSNLGTVVCTSNVAGIWSKLNESHCTPTRTHVDAFLKVVVITVITCHGRRKPESISKI